MIFLNNKVKSLLFSSVVLLMIISLSCVCASDLDSDGMVGDETNAESAISTSGEIYIAPDGMGSGESEDSPANWNTAYSSSMNGDTIIFLDGNYSWNSMQSISKSLILKGQGNSVIDANNSNGFFRTSAGTTIQLVGLTFFNAETGDTETGGIVNNGILIVNNCTFKQNTGWGTEGGAIHNSGSCDVYNSTFFSNTAKKGGSFYGDKHSILNVYNCLFIKGSSKEGNCFNIKEGTANIYNCNFVNCSAKSGIIHTKKGNVNIYNSNFTNSRAVDYAACVDVDKESSVLIENCIFNRCSSTGGVIWNTNGEKVGTGDGGAVYVEKGGSLTIRNSEFIKCSAKANGGALYIESRGDAIVDNCTFISNTAAQGRHIYIEGTAPSVTNCIFEVNDTLTALNVSSGSDVNVNVLVDVGTNFMNYNIPVLVDGNEEGSISSSSLSLTLSNLADGNHILSLGSNDKTSANSYIFTQDSADFIVGNNSSSGNVTPIDNKTDDNKTDDNQTGDNETDNNKTDDNSTEDNVTYMLTAPEIDLYYKNGARFYAFLLDSEGNGIADKEVIINLNGVANRRTTNSNGSVSIGVNLNSGIYDVSVTCENLSASSKITVLSTVEGNDLVKVFKNESQYYATFLDGEGNPLADGTQVEFNINGLMYKRNVNGGEGKAKLNINLPQGEYVITAINPENGENHANNITVLSSIVNNTDLVKFYRNASQYVVTILGNDGNDIGAGETVTFNINGVFYNRVTDASGKAKLNLNLVPGDYVITAEYNGCKVSNNIKILPVLSASDIEKVYGEAKSFDAYLVDGQGNPLANETVLFNINGVFYNRVTDAEGIAHLNINLQAGEYIITSAYNGANIANKVTVKSQ